eukprot:750652-Hanusia_phi.AAC.2
MPSTSHAMSPRLEGLLVLTPTQNVFKVDVSKLLQAPPVSTRASLRSSTSFMRRGDAPSSPPALLRQQLEHVGDLVATSVDECAGSRTGGSSSFASCLELCRRKRSKLSSHSAAHLKQDLIQHWNGCTMFKRRVRHRQDGKGFDNAGQAFPLTRTYAPIRLLGTSEDSRGSTEARVDAYSVGGPVKVSA